MTTKNEVIQAMESKYDSYIVVGTKLGDGGKPVNMPYLAVRGDVTLLAQMLLYAHATIAISTQEKLEEIQKEATDSDEATEESA